MSYMQVVFVPIIMLNSKSLITEIKFEWKQNMFRRAHLQQYLYFIVTLTMTIALDNNKNEKKRKPSDIFFIYLNCVCVVCVYVVHMGPHSDVPA